MIEIAAASRVASNLEVRRPCVLCLSARDQPWARHVREAGTQVEFIARQRPPQETEHM